VTWCRADRRENPNFQKEWFAIIFSSLFVSADKGTRIRPKKHQSLIQWQTIPCQKTGFVLSSLIQWVLFYAKIKRGTLIAINAAEWGLIERGAPRIWLQRVCVMADLSMAAAATLSLSVR
jgi:hypothetical protein